MTKFTKGPWTYYEYDNLITAKGINRLIDIIPRSLEVSTEERIANGYLIAAAPELYEALKWLLASIDAPTSAIRKEAINKARKAIIKATEGV